MPPAAAKKDPASAKPGYQNWLVMPRACSQAGMQGVVVLHNPILPPTFMSGMQGVMAQYQGHLALKLQRPVKSVDRGTLSIVRWQ